MCICIIYIKYTRGCKLFCEKLSLPQTIKHKLVWHKMHNRSALWLVNNELPTMLMQKYTRRTCKPLINESMLGAI